MTWPKQERLVLLALPLMLAACSTTVPPEVEHASQAAEPAPAPQVIPTEADKDLVRLFNGIDLAGWRIIDQYEFEKHGKVYVKDGSVVLEEGDPMTGIAWAGDFPTTGYEVALEAMRVTGDDFFCGMTGPVGDSWVTLIVGGWGGMVVGLSNVDGMNASENQTTQGMIFDSNRWYPIRFCVTEAAIQVWINEKRVIDQPREGHRFNIWWQCEPARPFGIKTWHTGGALRNITLRRLGE